MLSAIPYPTRSEGGGFKMTTDDKVRYCPKQCQFGILTIVAITSFENFLQHLSVGLVTFDKEHCTNIVSIVSFVSVVSVVSYFADGSFPMKK